VYYDSSTNELWSEEAKNLNRVYYPSSSIYELGKISIHNYEGKKGKTIILPDLSSYLICYVPLNPASTPFAKLIGPRTKSIVITHGRRRSTYILRLKPGSLGFDNRIHVSELINKSIDFSELFPELWRSLLEALGTKNEVLVFEKMCAIFTSLNNCPNTAIIERLNNLLNGNDIYKVNTVAKQLGISERYLRKIFDRHIGISPNHSFRIVRLIRSLEMKNPKSRIENWAGLAVGSGYYDQSHMISEYQRFLGCTPEALYFQ